MTDIDFDELDKAVNSALAPRMNDAVETTEPKVEAPKDTSVSRDEPAKEAGPTEAPRVIIAPRQPLAAPTSSPAARRSGRFMDVVHPSSDMAAEKRAPQATKVKIVPTENAPKPEEIEKKPSELDKTEEPTVSVVDMPSPADEVTVGSDTAAVDAVEPPEEMVKSEYPDPIDIAGPLSIAEEPTKLAEEAQSENEDGTEKAEETDATPAPVAGDAPFLPDAKVEKRPLGGFAPEEIEETDDKEELKADESQLPPEADLPAALQSDVVAVESDALPDMLPGQMANDDEDEADKPEESKHDAPKVEAKEEPVQHQEGAPQSIPQQYKSAPVSADEEPRPVFDTDQYHQPLIPAHSGKKSHALAFILLIAALLAIGGTLGYFAFMSGL